jgi:hypothetical protein
VSSVDRRGAAVDCDRKSLRGLLEGRRCEGRREGSGVGPGANDASFENLDIFDHRRPSGRVDIERKGNAFTLLLSPDAIDFDQPVIVTVNGKPAYQGVMKKDPAVLLKWAARDADRQRLYGAELRVQVP